MLSLCQPFFYIPVQFSAVSEISAQFSAVAEIGVQASTLSLWLSHFNFALQVTIDRKLSFAAHRTVKCASPDVVALEANSELTNRNAIAFALTSVAAFVFAAKNLTRTPMTAGVAVTEAALLISLTLVATAALVVAIDPVVAKRVKNPKSAATLETTDADALMSVLSPCA